MFDCLLIVSPFQVFLMQYRHDILQQVLPELLKLPWEVLRVDSQYDYPNEHPPDAAFSFPGLFSAAWPAAGGRSGR